MTDDLHDRIADMTQLRSTVALTELADAMRMPPKFTRAYLRAANARLAAAGIVLRERRLGEEGVAGSDIDMFPAFIGPKEKRAIKEEAKKLDALVSRTRKKLDQETAKLSKMRARTETLKVSDAKARQHAAVGNQMTVLADLEIAYVAAQALSAQARPDIAHLDALLDTYTGYAVALTRQPITHQENAR